MCPHTPAGENIASPDFMSRPHRWAKVVKEMRINLGRRNGGKVLMKVGDYFVVINMMNGL